MYVYILYTYMYKILQYVSCIKSSYMSCFAEGGLEMCCGSPHVTHHLKCEPTKITFAQISVSFRNSCEPQCWGSLCAPQFFGMGTTHVCLILLYVPGLILVTFCGINTLTTIPFPVLAAEKCWSTYRLWGRCSLMIAGDSVRAMLIEKDSLQMWSFVGALAITRALRAGITVPSCSASLGDGAPTASSPRVWVLSCFFAWCS